MSEFTKIETKSIQEMGKSLVVSYADFLDDSKPERRFRLVYPNKEIFYLTQEERDHLLNQVNGGARYVQIGEHTFTNSFIVLYPIKDKIKKEFTEIKDKNGKIIGYKNE